MSSMASSLGQPDQAERLATEALTYFRREQDSGAMAYLLNILGQLAAQRDDLADAESMLEEALAINRTVIRGRQGTAWTLRNLGMVAQRQGDMQRAAACYGESLLLRYELRQLAGVAWAMEGLAEVATLTGRRQRAVRLWSAASTLRASVGSEIDGLGRLRHEQMLADLRTTLGEQQFGDLWAEGSILSLEAAIGYALETDELTTLI
jgi:tetratricopeptide (TPR) repeat protein